MSTSRILLVCSPFSRVTMRSPRAKRMFSICSLVGISALCLSQKSNSTCTNDDTANRGLEEANLREKMGKKNDSGDKEPGKNAIMDSLVDFFSRLGFSGIMGVCSGYAAKRLSHDLMFVGGLVFGTAQIFAYCG